MPSYRQWCENEWKMLRAMSISDLNERMAYIRKKIRFFSDSPDYKTNQGYKNRVSDMKRDLVWAMEALREKGGKIC